MKKPKHGGKRKGAGRPVTVRHRKVTLSLDDETVARIDAQAKNWKCSRSAAVRVAFTLVNSGAVSF